MNKCLLLRENELTKIGEDLFFSPHPFINKNGIQNV